MSLKILLAEDSCVYRRLVARCLKDSGFDLVLAKDGAAAWHLLQQTDAPRLVLFDWVLPRIDGLELCRRIRKLETSESYTYTVIMTAKNRKEDLVDAMEAGADDYLVKPFEPAELRARLFAGQRILNLHRELVSTRESFRFAATHDFLTGILNRAEVMAVLERELARGRREHKPVSVILADIDHFKQINDSLGHLDGDAVLQKVAAKLKSELRVYDSVGRYGGEEFLLIMPGCDLSDAIDRADSLRQMVQSDVSVAGIGALTLSMGVTATRQDYANTLEALLQEADIALYRAKERGRNRVEPAALACVSASIPSDS